MHKSTSVENPTFAIVNQMFKASMYGYVTEFNWCTIETTYSVAGQCGDTQNVDAYLSDVQYFSRERGGL